MSYGYDSIYRLTSETIADDPNNVNGAASYDAVGNRRVADRLVAEMVLGAASLRFLQGCGF